MGAMPQFSLLSNLPRVFCLLLNAMNACQSTEASARQPPPLPEAPSTWGAWGLPSLSLNHPSTSCPFPWASPASGPVTSMRLVHCQCSRSASHICSVISVLTSTPCCHPLNGVLAEQRPDLSLQSLGSVSRCVLTRLFNWIATVTLFKEQCTNRLL